MADFMVTIHVSGIDEKSMEKLRPEEGVVLKRWIMEGTLKAYHVRQDLSGAFLVLQANTLEEVENLLKTLPMFPYMKLEIVALEVEKKLI